MSPGTLAVCAFKPYTRRLWEDCTRPVAGVS